MRVSTPGVEVDPGPGHGGRESAQPFPLPHRMAAFLHLTPGHQAELGHHFRPHFSIFCQVAVVLELEDCGLGLGAEHAVYLAGVEPKGVEPGLELGDVLSSVHGPPEEQEPVAEAISRLPQGAPGVRPDDPVDVESLRLLERRHRGLRPRPKAGAGVRAGIVPQGAQAVLDVSDRVPFIAEAIEPHAHMVAGAECLTALGRG